VFTGNATSQDPVYHQSLFMRDNLDNKDHKMILKNLGQGLDVDAVSPKTQHKIMLISLIARHYASTNF
jgi:hypothetical protein